MTTEPVRLVAAIKALIGSVLALICLFGVDLSTEQIGGILLVYTCAAETVTALLVRSKVTPVADLLEGH